MSCLQLLRQASRSNRPLCREGPLLTAVPVLVPAVAAIGALVAMMKDCSLQIEREEHSSKAKRA